MPSSYMYYNLGFATIAINKSFNKQFKNILAMIRLELATIVLDPNFVKNPEPGRLHVIKTLRGRPSKFKGKALARLN